MSKTKVLVFILLTVVFMIGCATLGFGGNEEEGSAIGNLIGNVLDKADSNDSDANEGNSAELGDDDTSSTASGTTLEETDFGKLLASGALEIAGIEALEDGETVGEILSIHFVNNSDDEIKVVVPCGLVFAPDDSDEQPLMMVQPMEVSLAAGEEVTLEPYVVCADLGTAAPGLGSGYTIGYLEDEKLLKFAECICGEEVDTSIGSMDSLGIQFATWSISIDGDVHNLIDNTEDSALSEMMEGMTIDEFADYFSGFLDMFGNDWLNRCDIVIEE